MELSSYRDLLASRKIQAAMILVVLAGAAVTFSQFQDQTYEMFSCEYDNNWNLSYGQLTFHRENRTATFEINETTGVTSEHIENMTVLIMTSKAEISVNGDRSDGVIASSEQPGQAAAEFPLEPVNVTIYGQTGDSVGIEPEHTVRLRYYQQSVERKDYCPRQRDRILFKTNETGIKWKNWKPYDKWQEY